MKITLKFEMYLKKMKLTYNYGSIPNYCTFLVTDVKRFEYIMDL